jgi:hypothetical protein
MLWCKSFPIMYVCTYVMAIFEKVLLRFIYVDQHENKSSKVAFVHDDPGKLDWPQFLESRTGKKRSPVADYYPETNSKGLRKGTYNVQGDQRSLLKNGPKCSKKHFFVEINR